MPDVHTSPDLSSIVQEVIDQPGWHSGNAIVIIVKPIGSGTTSRRVLGWERNDDSFQTARLQIWYTEPTPPTPTPSLTPAPPPAPTGLTAVFYDDLPHPTDQLNAARPDPTPVIGKNTFVRLSWYGSYPAGTTFRIYRNGSSPVPVDAAHRIASSTNRWYTDYAGFAGDWYVVTAVNSVGESAPSNQAQAHPYCLDC